MKLNALLEAKIVEYESLCKKCYNTEYMQTSDYDEERYDYIVVSEKDVISKNECTICGCNLFDVDAFIDIKVTY